MSDISPRAIVSYGPHKDGGWKMQNISLRKLKEKELLVEMVASGICQTDLHFAGMDSGFGVHYPRIMGHEGVGYVREVGSKVESAKPGDPVILSFACCKSCEQCDNDHPAHCAKFNPLNFQVVPDNYVARDSASAGTEHNIYGKFFGQSSFASWSVVQEESVINVQGLVEKKEELCLLSPLGCGIQTGCGAIVNALNAGKSDRVVIMGLGGVGLSAIMGAKIQNCKTIIGVDRFPSRLDLAKELGATHVVNTENMKDLSDLTEQIRQITDGLGATIALDTTGFPPLIREAINFIGFKGRLAQVGTAPETATLNIPIFEFMVAGKQFIGVVEGDVVPQVFVPKMIQWYREGRLPLDKIVDFYQADAFEDAIQDMRGGKALKPVILW